MFTKKTIDAYVFFYQPLAKGYWAKQWNKLGVFKEAKKFPKYGFLNSQFDKWLHLRQHFGIKLICYTLEICFNFTWDNCTISFRNF